MDECGFMINVHEKNEYKVIEARSPLWQGMDGGLAMLALTTREFKHKIEIKG